MRSSKCDRPVLPASADAGRGRRLIIGSHRCDPSKSHAESGPTLRNMFRRVFAFKDVIHSFPLSPPKLIVVLQVRKRRRTWRGELRLIQTFLMEGVFNENHADLSSQASPNSHVGSRLW